MSELISMKNRKDPAGVNQDRTSLSSSDVRTAD